MNAKAYLGLGGNLGNPKETFERALHLISPFACINKVSKLYKSLPFGYSEQPPFINAAVLIKTNLPPNELLSQLQRVEIELGKKFICENGPRVIDIDLLLYGDQIIETNDLNLPHPEILKRDFVLLPLNDLNPQLTHPEWGSKTLKSAISGLQNKYVEDNPDKWEILC